MSSSMLQSKTNRYAPGIAVVFVACLIVLVVCAFAWGNGQQYTPEYVEHRLAVGMTLDEVAYKLGPIEDLTANHEELKGGGWRTVISQAGLGAWFAPQHEVSLEFNRTGHLQNGYATVLYQLSDRDMALTLNGPGTTSAQ